MAETVSVTLPAEQWQALRESVEAGESASIDAALSEAVRAWQRDHADHAERIALIKARIRRSLDDPRSPLTIDEVRARIEALHAETVEAHRNEAS